MPLAFTGPTVALPSIGLALGGSPVSISWATNAYLLTFGSLLLAAGSLADRYGRKLVFAIGTGGFAILSVMLALVPGGTGFTASATTSFFTRSRRLSRTPTNSSFAVFFLSKLPVGIRPRMLIAWTTAAQPRTSA
jgi:MFS family permease